MEVGKERDKTPVPDYPTGLFVGCLTSQQHASVSQGRICSDKFKCCHTEIKVADQTFHLTQSQYTDTGPTSPSTDYNARRLAAQPLECQFLCHWYDSTPKKNPGGSGIQNLGSPALDRPPSLGGLVVKASARERKI